MIFYDMTVEIRCYVKSKGKYCRHNDVVVIVVVAVVSDCDSADEP